MHPIARSLSCGLLLLLLHACALPPKQPPPADLQAVIVDARIVDVRSGALRTAQDLFIARGRIADIRPTGRTLLPPGVPRLDARGGYVIPGLWDMHVHWFERETLPLFVANGVTGVRQMASTTLHYQWRVEGIEGTPQAPRQVLGTPMLDGPQPVWGPDLAIALGDAAAARQAVALFARSGAEFLKVYSKLRRETYFALLDSARAAGLPVVGHVPPEVSWLEAIAAGQRDIEHLTELEFATSRDGAAIAREQQALYEQLQHGGAQGDEAAGRRAGLRLRGRALDTRDEARVRELLAALARAPVWQCPTRIVARTTMLMDAESPQDDPRLAYLPAHQREQFRTSDYHTGIIHELLPGRRRLLDYGRDMVGRMHAAGVPLLAGTDVGTPYVYPGFSLHDELELLVGSGLTPLDALRTATLNPARFLGRERDFGAVEPGLRADLVILEQDPRADIRATRAIRAVAIGGTLLDRAALDLMLSRVREHSTRPHVEQALLPTLDRLGIEATVARYEELRRAQPQAYSYSLASPLLIVGALVHGQRWPELLRLTELLAHGALAAEAPMHEALGDQYLAFGRADAARAAYRRALELAPGAPGLLLKLARLEAAQPGPAAPAPG